MIFFSLINKVGIHTTVGPHQNPGDLCKAKFINSGGIDNLYTVMVWAFICE